MVKTKNNNDKNDLCYNLLKHISAEIDQTIYEIIKSSALENNLSIDFDHLILDSSFNNNSNDSSIFKYLFFKLKENIYSTIITKLIPLYDDASNKFVAKEQVLYKTIALTHLNKKKILKWDNNQSFNENKKYNSELPSPVDTVSNNFSSLKNTLKNTEALNKMLDSHFSNCDIYDVYYHIYSNMTNYKSHMFFYNDYSFRSTLERDDILFPFSTKHYLSLFLETFNASAFGLSDFLSCSNTGLKNTIHQNRVRNSKDIYEYLIYDFKKFTTLLKELDTEFDNKFEKAYVYSKISKIFRNDFINSLSNRNILKLLNNIDINSLYDFLKNRYSNSSNNFISHEHTPLTIISDSYNLFLLEMLCEYNINLSNTNIDSLTNVHSCTIKLSGGETYIETIQPVEYIKKQHNSLNDIYNFLLDVLSSFHQSYGFNNESTTDGIINFFKNAFLDTYKEEIKDNTIKRDIILSTIKDNNLKTKVLAVFNEYNDKLQNENNISESIYQKMNDEYIINLFDFINIFIDEFNNLPTVNYNPVLKVEIDKELNSIFYDGSQMKVISYLLSNSSVFF